MDLIIILEYNVADYWLTIRINNLLLNTRIHCFALSFGAGTEIENLLEGRLSKRISSEGIISTIASKTTD